LQNALINLQLEQNYADALKDLGYKIEDLYDFEHDPSLGNGGLGRLAACYLDSMASRKYPGWGYGIRYDYGIFRQQIMDGYQIEFPDYWLMNGNPWEVERTDVRYNVRFYGTVNKQKKDGKEISTWENGEIISAIAYDNIIPGYNTFNSINLRLWKSIPQNDFNFEEANKGIRF